MNAGPLRAWVLVRAWVLRARGSWMRRFKAGVGYVGYYRAAAAAWTRSYS